MRHAVRGPQIAGIAVDRSSARGLRLGVVAAFLMREAAAAEDGVEAGQIFAPMALDAEHRCQHGIGSPEPEIDEMRQAEGQDVARMLGQDLFPDLRGTVRLAVDPAPQRRDMRTLARCRLCGEARRIRRGHFGDRHRGLLVGQHGEIALQAMRQAELGVGLEQRRHALRSISAITQIAHQRVVECLHRRRGCCRHLQPVSVSMHRCLSPAADVQHATNPRAWTRAAAQAEAGPTMVETLMIAVFGVFAAALLRGFTGFGFGLAAVPLLSLALPPAKVVPFVVVLQVIVGVVGLRQRLAAVRLARGARTESREWCWAYRSAWWH